MCPNHIHARPATPLTHLASVNFTPEWHGKGRLQGQHVEPFVTESPDFVGIHFYHQPGVLCAALCLRHTLCRAFFVHFSSLTVPPTESKRVRASLLYGLGGVFKRSPWFVLI